MLAVLGGFRKACNLGLARVGGFRKACNLGVARVASAQLACGPSNRSATRAFSRDARILWFDFSCFAFAELSSPRLYRYNNTIIANMLCRSGGGGQARFIFTKQGVVDGRESERFLFFIFLLRSQYMHDHRMY